MHCTIENNNDSAPRTCGALLLAQLYREVDILNISSNKIIFWSDSTIVLHWLKTSPHRLNTFVASRVAMIQEINGVIEWQHVRSEDNPADAISRGQLPHAFSRNQTWFSGPTLSKNEDEWPGDLVPLVVSEIPELKRNVCLISLPSDPEIFNKYASYSKLLRIMAYCRRFRSTNTYSGSLSAEEINEVEIRILKLAQSTQFIDEIQRLKNKNSKLKDRIANLDPFLDEHSLIRVGGCLQMSNLTSATHPIYFQADTN